MSDVLLLRHNEKNNVFEMNKQETQFYGGKDDYRSFRKHFERNALSGRHTGESMFTLAPRKSCFVFVRKIDYHHRVSAICVQHKKHNCCGLQVDVSVHSWYKAKVLFVDSV